MIYEGFKVYKKEDDLLEELPAILYTEGNDIVAQVPEEKNLVAFVNGDTGEIIEEAPVVEGKARITFKGPGTVRVGDPTKTRMNQVTIVPPPAAPVKQEDKLDHLGKLLVTLDLRLRKGGL